MSEARHQLPDLANALRALAERLQHAATDLLACADELDEHVSDSEPTGITIVNGEITPDWTR